MKILRKLFIADLKATSKYLPMIHESTYSGNTLPKFITKTNFSKYIKLRDTGSIKNYKI